MSSLFLLWWFVISNGNDIYHISTIGPSSLPRAMDSMVIGYDNTNNLIWLIGGADPHGHSLISFNLSLWNDTNAFLDHDYPLSDSIFSHSQAYIQTGSVVYVV